MKKIAIIILILILLAIISIGVYWFLQSNSLPNNEEEENNGVIPNPLEQACINSGGQVSTSLCCASASDFPNLCLIGACGCSPDNSKEIKTCDCGEGKCFDGEKCVNSGLTICLDSCGDGTCQKMTCDDMNCPCLESPQDCPQDCQE